MRMVRDIPTKSGYYWVDYRVGVIFRKIAQVYTVNGEVAKCVQIEGRVYSLKTAPIEFWSDIPIPEPEETYSTNNKKEVSVNMLQYRVLQSQYMQELERLVEEMVNSKDEWKLQGGVSVLVTGAGNYIYNYYQAITRQTVDNRDLLNPTQ